MPGIYNSLFRHGNFYKTNPHGTPAILHTSREARTIGLEHYILSVGSAFTGAIGTATVQITSPPKIWVNWDCDNIFPMKTFNDNLDDNRAGYFVSNIIHDELQGKGASKMAFDIDNTDSPLWGSQFAANSNSTCQEVIVHCGFDAISQSFHSNTPVELDIINLRLGEDMEKKLGEAGMDPRLNVKFVFINALWEDAKRIHRSTNGIGKAGGAEPAEDWDPVLKFMLIVARKT